MKKGALKDFIIPFAGLSLGKHIYNLKVENSFFENLEYSEIKKGEFNVEITLNKQVNMLILDFLIEGWAEVMCDRCGDDFNLPLKSENQLIVKLADKEFEESDQIISIPGTQHEIDLAHFIYEYIILSMPSRKIHPDKENGESGCDPVVLKKLEQIAKKEKNSKTDPRWEALKNIKTSKN
jgi:uncharacterized protein